MAFARLRLLTETVCGLVLCVLLAGCLGMREGTEEPPPDQQFGHRYDEQGPDGRVTVYITPPDSARAYFYYPAPVDTVHIRPAPFDPEHPASAQEVSVEALIKGGFPDACTELHEVTQQRSGNIINLFLEMRRPQGAVCASVRRPYRFYVTLEGRYQPGHYTLKINDDELQVFPFEIRAPESDLQ